MKVRSDEMTEFTPEWIAGAREVVGNDAASPSGQIAFIALDHIERLQKRVQELEVQLKSKDIIINNQQGRLNYYATKDLLGEKNGD